MSTTSSGLRFTPTHVHDFSGDRGEVDGEALLAEDEAQIRNLLQQVRRKAQVGRPMGVGGDVGGRKREEEGGGNRESGAQEAKQEVGLHFQQVCSSLFPFPSSLRVCAYTCIRDIGS